MYVNTPPKRCRKCDSLRNETFTQPDVTGIRCLKCGHESRTVTTHTESSESIKWISTEVNNVF